MMLLNRKLKAIKKNILVNGGATYNSNLKESNFKRGYMVSLAGYETQLNIKKLNMKVLRKYRKTAKKLNGFIGFWIDNGILYLDISKHYISKNQACKNAIKNNQLALYDIYNQKSIYTKDFIYKTKSKIVLSF